MFAFFEIQLLCYISNLCFHVAMCMFASWHEYNIFLFCVCVFFFLLPVLEKKKRSFSLAVIVADISLFKNNNNKKKHTKIIPSIIGHNDFSDVLMFQTVCCVK